MRCEKCNGTIPQDEQYTDFYYCKKCDRNYDNKVYAKDHCAGCEHPEVLHMLLPRIEELENRVKELEAITKKHEKHLINAFNMIEKLVRHSL